MIKRLTLLALATSVIFSTGACADEAAARKAVESILGKNAKIDSVRKAGVLNFYEVVAEGEIFYVDEKGTYLFHGNILDVKARKDLTGERKIKLSQIKFSDLPLDLAIKQVRGNGKRVIATFEDPNCGYCKKLAKEIVGMNDITVYTFLLPILSPDSKEKSKNIWCASNKVKAWNDWMVSGVVPPAAKCDASAVDKTVALGQKYNITGTPTIFFSDGNRAPGYMEAAKLEQAIAAAATGTN